MAPATGPKVTFPALARLRVWAGLLGVDAGEVVRTPRPARCQHPCISPLHTHFASGWIHIEAPKIEPFTLGQFFIEWGVRLTASCVANYCRPSVAIHVYIDGALHSGDPARIPLIGFQELAVVVGTPPKQIPACADFNNIL